MTLERSGRQVYLPWVDGAVIETVWLAVVRIGRTLTHRSTKRIHMARSLWEVFRSVFGRSDGNSEDAEEDDDRFVPSPVDLSIRFAHGGSDTEVQRELDEINERARELEDNRPDE